MTTANLKNFAKALQAEMKRVQKTQPLTPVKVSNKALEDLIRERDTVKALYIQEERKLNDSKVVLESQKRLLEKSNPLNAVNQSMSMFSSQGGNIQVLDKSQSSVFSGISNTKKARPQTGSVYSKA